MNYTLPMCVFHSCQNCREDRHNSVGVTNKRGNLPIERIVIPRHYVPVGSIREMESCDFHNVGMVKPRQQPYFPLKTPNAISVHRFKQPFLCENVPILLTSTKPHFTKSAGPELLSIKESCHVHRSVRRKMLLPCRPLLASISNCCRGCWVSQHVGVFTCDRVSLGRRVGIDIHGHHFTPAGADHNIGLLPVKLSLSDANGGVTITSGQGRAQDLVAVVFEKGRGHTARCRLPAVNEEDSHLLHQGGVGTADVRIAKAVTPSNRSLHRPYPVSGNDFGDFLLGSGHPSANRFVKLGQLKGFPLVSANFTQPDRLRLTPCQKSN